MSKESFDREKELEKELGKEREKELEQMEKEVGNLVGRLEKAPLRQDFQGNLRHSLQMVIQKEKEEQKDNSKKGLFWLKRLMSTRNAKIAAGFLVLFLLCGGLFGVLGKWSPAGKPVYAEGIEIKALQEDKLGVAAESAFLLTSADPLDERTVKGHLKVYPAFEYSLDKKAGGTEYKIIPKKKLAANTVYKFSFDPEGKERESLSWAFQTKSQFRIMSTLPGNKTTYVPVDTGIEIAFSHENFSEKKIAEYLKISPQVKGRFEKHKKTLVFVPERLEPQTLYTVTVNKGLPLLDSTDTLAEEYCFSFETASIKETESEFAFELEERLQDFSTTETPVFSVYANFDAQHTQGKVPSVAISLYRYADNQSFIKALQKKEQAPSWSYFAHKLYREDFTGLAKVGEYKTDFLSVDKYSHYFVFPEKLPVGYYAAEIQAGETQRQVWFQVTDLIVYQAQTAAQSLFWVNDLNTKKPVAGAEAFFADAKASFKGNAQGVILAEQKDSLGEGSYALIKKDRQEIVVPLFSTRETNYTEDELDIRDYWKYLYLDRELFKPGDTLNFWGVLAPRKGVAEIQEVEVEIVGRASLLSKKVKIDNKIFTGEIQLPILSPGYYYLQVKKGATVLLSTGFSVELYQKPAYKISVEPEKKAVFAGEKVKFLAQAAFFEGTAVPKANLHYRVQDKEGTVTTDAQGLAAIPYTTVWCDLPNSAYHNVYLGVDAVLPEAGEISTSGKVLVFPSKVYLEGTVKKDEEGFTLNTQLSQVELSKVNAGEYPEKNNFLSGPVAGSLIKGKLYQDVWQKEESGHYYNFITKKVEKRYYYHHSTKQLSDFEMVTDQEGKAVFQGTLPEEGTYYLELTAQDPEGRLSKSRIHIGEYSYGYADDYKYYHLSLEKEENAFVPGEEVLLTFLQNDNKLSPREKSFLFIRGQKEIAGFTVSDNPQYTFAFKEGDLPNVNVGGVYFDGTAYQTASPYSVRFNKEKKALNIKITTDKNEYRPKDKVQLKVQVTDEQDKPVKAQVNLNLVDEALYQLLDQQVDFLSRLYNDDIYLYLRTRVSHYHPNVGGGGAECGGEGGSERQDFFDTVLFTTVETNSRGQASAEFTLPDNLTSWRITYHGLTADLKAGSGTAQLPVRLPFFVEMVLNEAYLKGDTPVIVIRSFGDKVSADAAVTYSMELSGPTGEKVVKTGKGVVGEDFDWQLPSLQEGKYTLVVEGKSGEYRDKLKREFTVAASFLERTLTTHQLLEEGLPLKGSEKEPTLVVFSDYEKSQYLRGLYNLVWQFGGRLEQKLAAREACQLLEQYFAKENFFSGEEMPESLLAYQKDDGGISILPYGESDLALTALVASVSSKDFDRSALLGYFYKILEAGEEKGEEAGEDVTLALWGLGALGEPVLLEINASLAQPDLAPAQKVHLALAALDMGNGAYARQVYQELLTKYGEKMGNTLRIKTGKDQDEIITATTQMALLAARLGTAEKNSFYQYVLENPGKELLNNLEQVQILQYNLRYMDTEPVSFTYELRGKKVQKTLEGRETFTLYVLPEDLPEIKFSAITGKVGVMTAYSRPYQQEQLPSQADLEVKRTYKVNGRVTKNWQRGDLVEVVLNYQIKEMAPRGKYELVDVLPAGLSYLRKPYRRTGDLSNAWRYPSEVKGQKITFNVHKAVSKDQAASSNSVGKIVYYARVLSPGEFLAQGALLSQINNQDLWVLGQEERIVIK